MVIKLGVDILVLKAQFFGHNHCVRFHDIDADNRPPGCQAHDAVPELKFGVEYCPGMARALIVSEARPVQPAVGKLLLPRLVPLPVHHLLRGRDTRLIAGHRVGVGLGVRPVEVQRRDVDRVLPQFFSDPVDRYRQRIPAHRVVLAAEPHLPAVAVDDLHILFDVLAPGGEIGAKGLVHSIAEIGAPAGPAVRNRKIVDRRDQAVRLEAYLQVHIALVQVEVVHPVAVIDASDWPAGPLG